MTFKTLKNTLLVSATALVFVVGVKGGKILPDLVTTSMTEAKTMDKVLNNEFTIKAGSETLVNGIKVKYGTHTYNVENQKQYDYVMEKIEEVLSFKGKAGKDLKASLDSFDKDEKVKAEVIKRFKEQGITNEATIRELYKVDQAMIGVLCHNVAGADGLNTDNAYSKLKFGKGNNNAIAMVALAVADSLGYPVKLVANNYYPTEYWLQVKVSGVDCYFDLGKLGVGGGISKPDIVILEK
jgi:hypothetical protein